ncbi:TIGR03749 family integrating conjugative element protein, partial [Pseudomonas aeruginosa]|nr:TIGR03749 family integrating conjugative element protein [Pseudomonas aeruginosa]
MIRKSTGSLLLMLALPTLAHAVEILRWERIPLAIPLTVGQERIVFVDRNVRVGVPRDLQGKLRVQSTGGALYLLANEPIPPARLRLQDATNGEQMLIDIAASEAAADQQPREPVRIVAGEPVAPHYGQPREAQPSAAAKQTAQAEAPKAVPRETPVPVVLTRYAAQMLYAPLRTVEPVDGVGQVRVKRQLDLNTLLPSLPITATALGAWRLDDYY